MENKEECGSRIWLSFWYLCRVAGSHLKSSRTHAEIKVAAFFRMRSPPGPPDLSVLSKKAKTACNSEHMRFGVI